eukprot:TRINITY_DN7893_c0_g1_i6.p1 TRINITY_DN7893_c0_g1~~TRINITY_DN7893_c0_g1_i6.p1  ORF type:complete len:680 (+),score=97.96 TRINITY_DN7893_c0_g1_i6:215-2041(+)
MTSPFSDCQSSPWRKSQDNLQEFAEVVEHTVARHMNPVMAKMRDAVREEMERFFVDQRRLVSLRRESAPASCTADVAHEWTTHHMRRNMEDILCELDDSGLGSKDEQSWKECRERAPSLSRSKTMEHVVGLPHTNETFEAGDCDGKFGPRKASVASATDTAVQLPCTPLATVDGTTEDVSQSQTLKTCATLNLTRESHVSTGLTSRKSMVGRLWALRKQPSSLSIGSGRTPWPTVRSRLRIFLKNPMFDQFICFLILVNSLCVGLATDFHARYLDHSPSVYISILGGLEVFFFVCFLMELLIRVFAYARRLCSRGLWHWTLLDVVAVATQAVEIIATRGGEELHHLPPANLSFMRVMRFVRLVRVARLARIVYIFKDLRALVYSILNSVRSLFWTCVLLFFMIFTISLYFTQLVTEARSRGADHPGLEQFFGSVPVSMRSFFQALTGGVDWQDLVTPLEADVSVYISNPICAYIAFAQLAMLNVVTGVFVESVLENSKVDKELMLVNNARELFRSLEGGLNGLLSWELFEEKLDTVPLQEFFKSIGVDRSEAKGLFRLLDLDDSGEISADEFLSGCLRLNGNAKALDLALLIREIKSMENRLFSQGGF